MKNTEEFLKSLSWDEFCCYRVYVECAPRHAVKNRGHLLAKIELEHKRRLEHNLIPKDLPNEPPF